LRPSLVSISKKNEENGEKKNKKNLVDEKKTPI
jgi:hypothetical protein